MTKRVDTTASQEAAHTSVAGIPTTPLRFVWHTTKPFWPWLVLGVAFNTFTQLLNTYTAVFIGNFANASQTMLSPDDFAVWSGGFIVLLIGTFFCFRVSGFIIIKLGLLQHKRALELIKGYLMHHSHNYFINRFAGSLSGKLFHAGDNGTGLLIMCYYGLTRLVVSLTATGVVIGLYSLWLAGLYAGIIFVSVIVNLFLVRRRRPLVVAYSAASSKYRGEINDVITNIQAVRQYARLGHEYNALNESLTDRVEKDRKQWASGEWNHVVNNILAALLMVLMVGGIYLLLVSGRADIGAMVTVMILMYRVSGIMIDLGDWMNRMIRNYGQVEEGLAEIMVPYELADTSDAQSLSVENGNINFRNVQFNYEENKVFDNFNLSVNTGQRVGLVGPSGAGKTTFVSLLLRQHDLDNGSITIDGQDISKVTQDSLREHIAVVPQEPLLFHRTIRENIAYGKPDATEDEIIAVAKKAQAHEFITDLPEGYDTLVGERGVKLSGGQKQRVAIARAMLKDAPILVLDEATSALDSESEVAIQKALHELMAGKTVVAIAHRLSTLREMDRIIVMENGKVIEDGTHKGLSESGGTYQRLWEHQAGGFLQE